MNLDKIQRIDSSIYRLAKNFKILKYLSWPTGEAEKFLANWKKGNPTLPKINLVTPDQNYLISQLDKLRDECDKNEPIEKFLADTADSYALSGRMLASVGSKDFTLYSKRIYGLPDDKYKTQTITAMDAAYFLLDVTAKLLKDVLIPKTNFDIPPEPFAEWIRNEVDNFFGKDKVKVVVDDKISAKALASSKKIKISNGAMFSDMDKHQLLNHEAFIHTTTMLNGKEQILKCMSLAAPRTTRTQEGLAVMSELMTLSMDIMRLRRLALRVIATDMAIKGADFIEVFKYFLSEGQSEKDAVKSTQRIFRGGDVKGGVVFTKDTVYIKGLFEVHTFMKLAVSQDRVDYLRNLFSGRLTLGDAISLGPYFQNGWLMSPKYIPDWAKDFRILATTMAYSAFVTNINLKGIQFKNFLDYEDKLKRAS